MSTHLIHDARGRAWGVKAAPRPAFLDADDKLTLGGFDIWRYIEMPDGSFVKFMTCQRFGDFHER